MKTIFEQWFEGTYSSPGSYQQKVFEAYRIGSSGNQRRLQIAYPEWFIEMSKQSAALLFGLEEIRTILTGRIINYTMATAKVNLIRPVTLQAYDERLFQVRRFGGHVMVFTSSPTDGVVACRFLDDLSTEDLLALLLRLEDQEVSNEEEGQ